MSFEIQKIIVNSNHAGPLYIEVFQGKLQICFNVVFSRYDKRLKNNNFVGEFNINSLD